MGRALKRRKESMFWKTALSLVIGISLAAGGAQGQQNKKPAQVAPAVPDLAATMQALEEKLRSTGVAKAMVHAVELCGGGKKELF
jgi:outer membrane murein-binding lipoprotein Lpp